MHVPSRFTPLSMPRPALPPEERAARLKAAEQRYANSEKRASWRGSERYRNKLPVDMLGETSLHPDLLMILTSSSGSTLCAALAAASPSPAPPKSHLSSPSIAVLCPPC